MTSTVNSAAATPKRVTKMTSTQSLNHLLNFTLPPRQTHQLPSLPRRSRRPGNPPVWNKERFVNAQYRFVMNPTGDYTVHFADPDIFFQWNDILQVIIPRSSALASAAGQSSGQAEGHTTCPICLSEPTAPRMTKCGHVYCFPCILHYLNTAENKWARCPICFDSVNEKQLKSVKWYDGPVHTHVDVEEFHAESSSSASSSTAVETPFETEPRAGSTMHMRLMQRPQITTLALPRSHTWPSDLLPPHQAPFHFLPDVFSYAKFMLATPAYLISDLTRDLDELAAERQILARMKDEMGISFIDGAEEKVRNQMAKAAALESPLLRSKVDKALRDQREIEERTAFRIRRRKEEEARQNQSSDIPEEFLAFKGGLSNPSLPPPPPAGPITDRDANNRSNTNRNAPKARRNVNPPPPSTSTYYYYQASSGLPLFLHPLDIKILLSHFHIYASFPDTITVRVDAFAEGTVNDDLRKRCKYLAHMPEGADVVFIEADLEGVVGADGLKNFEGALKMRTSRRKEKGRKDDRARVRAEGRERERRNVESLAEWGVPLLSTPPSFQSQEFLLEGDVGEEPTTPVPVVPVSGAWGARSFASAAHAAPLQGGQPRPVRTPRDEADEWDMDVAFHELEQRGGGGGGRRKRSNKLVVLGGGGGRRR